MQVSMLGTHCPAPRSTPCMRHLSHAPTPLFSTPDLTECLPTCTRAFIARRTARPGLKRGGAVHCKRLAALDGLKHKNMQAARLQGRAAPAPRAQRCDPFPECYLLWARAGTCSTCLRAAWCVCAQNVMCMSSLRSSMPVRLAPSSFSCEKKRCACAAARASAAPAAPHGRTLAQSAVVRASGWRS